MSHAGSRRRKAHWAMMLAVVGVAMFGSVTAAYAVGTITGTVRNGLGAPIEGAEVAAFTVDTVNHYATTMVASAAVAPDGTYSLEVPAGNYLVGSRMATAFPDWQYFTPRRGGNAMNAFTAVLNTGRNVVGDGVTVPFIDIRLMTPVFFEGTVSSAATGAPLGNVHVGAAVFMPGEGWELVEETVTRPDGTYRLQTPPNADLALMDPPSYAIRFTDPAGVFANQVFDGQLYFQSGRQFDMLADETTTGVDGALVAGSRISGQVTDALTGAPVPFVSVDVFRFVPLAGVWEPVNLTGLAVLTDAFGNYSWGGLPPGDYKVKFAGDPGVYGPEFFGGLHVTDPNTVPGAAGTVTIAAEGQEVIGIDGQLDLFDGAAPLTKLNASTAWHSSPYAVSLSATDQVLPGTGVSSGVAYSQYRIPPGAWTTGTAFSVSGEGTIAVQYRSADIYGNLESAKTTNLRLDATAPVTSSNATATYVNVATVGLSATDNLSGVASTWARIDGGPASKLSTVTVFGAGAHTVQYWSVDAAGNAEAPKTVLFSIVQTPISRTDIAGADRVATAIAVSKRAYPDGSGAPKAVVVANAFAWADALSAASLAGVTDAPILLVDPARPGAISAELARLKALGAKRAFVIGGSTAMPVSAVRPVVSTFGQAKVSRIGGADRYAVSRAIAARTRTEILNAGGVVSGTAFVASGLQPYDALAASPVAAAKGYPIILARTDAAGRLDAATLRAITGLSVDQAIILGGTGAISSAAKRQLDTKLLGATVRLAGADRYATSAIVAGWSVRSSGLMWNRVAVAGGEAVADAMVGSVLQGQRGSVLLLTPATRLDQAPRNALTTNAGVIFDVTFIGGPRSLTPTTRAAALAALR